MRALQMTGYGDNHRLQLVDVAAPRPGPGELLIQVHYAGLNPVDFKTRNGMLRPVLPLKFPVIVGNEVAGTVAALGQGVKGFEPGQKVYVRLDKQRMGGFAEYVATAAELAAPVPQGLDLSIAAGVPLVSLTAWQALFEYGGVASGSKVLIHAGAGAVGRVAIQLARNAGAHVATTVSGRGIAVVESLGADTIINYREQRFEKLLEDYDFVLDTVGGDTLSRSFTVLKRGGKLCSLSATPEPRTADDLQAGAGLRLLFWLISWRYRRRAAQYGVDYRFLFMRPDGRTLQRISDEYTAGRLRFDIDRVYPLADYAKAYEDLEQGHAFGKLILQVNAEASPA